MKLPVNLMTYAILSAMLALPSWASDAPGYVVAEGEDVPADEHATLYVYSQINGQIVCIKESVSIGAFMYEVKYYYHEDECICAHVHTLRQTDPLDPASSWKHEYKTLTKDEVFPLIYDNKIDVKKDSAEALKRVKAHQKKGPEALAPDR